MAVLSTHRPLQPLHPLHALLLSFLFPLFLGTLISDIAYWRSYQIQWVNFAQWLNAGGLLMGGLAVLWAVVTAFRHRGTGNARPVLYLVLLAAAWVVGFLNALIHAKDAWAAMPAGLWLSAASTLLALAATWIGYSGLTDMRYAMRPDGRRV